MATGLSCASAGAGFEVDELCRPGPNPETRATSFDRDSTRRRKNRTEVSRFQMQRLPAPGPAAVDRAGLKDYTWHCNRRTLASRLVMTGVDLHMVGEPLGHPDSMTSKRYAHLSVHHTQASEERIAAGQSATKTAWGRNKNPSGSRKLL